MVGGPLEVRVSPLRLTQLLIDLVVNAGQAVASMVRTDVGQVRVRWVADRDRARIEVEDDGPGLPETLEQGEPSAIFTTKLAEPGPASGCPCAESCWRQMDGTLEFRRSTEGDAGADRAPARLLVGRS